MICPELLLTKLNHQSMVRYVSFAITTLTATSTGKMVGARMARLFHSKFSRTVPHIIVEQNLAARATSAFSIRGGARSNSTYSKTEFIKLADPAPGAPFHHAFPVHDLEQAKHFYGTILGCAEGRSSTKWQDYSLYGHQIVAHWVGNDYRCQDYYNPVDGDEVPVPHTGLALTVDEFHALAERVRQAGITFIIEPHLRFLGMPGEQWTMFFKDPSGNNLEFKAMTTPENLFAKYNVVEDS